MGKSKFQVKEFFGTVILKDWLREPFGGHQVLAIRGECSVVEDQELVGFRTRGNEANWVLRICGPTEQWTIHGCQIRGVVAHSPDAHVWTETVYVVK